MGMSGLYSNKSEMFLRTNSSVILSFLFGPLMWERKPVMIVFSRAGASCDFRSIRWFSTVNAHPYRVSLYTLSWCRMPANIISFRVSLTETPSRGLHTIIGSMCQRSNRSVVAMSLRAGSGVLSLARARRRNIKLDSTRIFYKLPRS